LEFSKRKRKTSKNVSDTEIHVASSLAQLGQKKIKAVVKKIVTAEVRRVPSAFHDDMIAEPHPKGFSSCLWCDLRFRIRRSYSLGSENELVDIESFLDGVTGAEQSTTDSVVITDAGGAAPRPSSPQDEASPQFTWDLERTVQRNEDPIENLTMIETREEHLEGQDPSTSIAAFNESFGTSYRGELLSVGRETAATGGGALLTVYFGTPNMFVTLWFGFDYGTNPPLGTIII
jgi:hypothetical protein